MNPPAVRESEESVEFRRPCMGHEMLTGDLPVAPTVSQEVG